VTAEKFLYRRKGDRIHVLLRPASNGGPRYARKVAEALLKRGEALGVELHCHPRYAYRAKAGVHRPK